MAQRDTPLTHSLTDSLTHWLVVHPKRTMASTSSIRLTQRIAQPTNLRQTSPLKRMAQRAAPPLTHSLTHSLTHWLVAHPKKDDGFNLQHTPHPKDSSTSGRPLRSKGWRNVQHPISLTHNFFLFFSSLTFIISLFFFFF